MRVLSVEKDGNKVKGYRCDDGGSEVLLSKDDIKREIDAGRVDNARVQVYKGNVIIRVSLPDENGNTPKRVRKPKENEEPPKRGKTFNEALIEIGVRYNISEPEKYVEYFYAKQERIAEERDFPITNDLNDQKMLAEVMHEGALFWSSIANMQIKHTTRCIEAEADELKYRLYCFEKDIEYTPETGGETLWH